LPAGRRGPLASRGPYARAYRAYRLMRPCPQDFTAVCLFPVCLCKSTERSGFVVRFSVRVSYIAVAHWLLLADSASALIACICLHLVGDNKDPTTP